MDIASRGYNHPEKLVSTDWLAKNLDNKNIRIVESNEDPLLYRSGHIPGAVEIDWVKDLNQPLTRDYLEREDFTRLCQRVGIDSSTTVIFYGDKNNWWACYALWIFELFGHTNTKILDGGRVKWEAEGRAVTREVPNFPPTDFIAPERDDKSERAFRDDVLQVLRDGSARLVDVRSPQEFDGTRLHMPDYPNEGAMRGGHIPGAKSVPWARAVNLETAEFKSATELTAIYEGEAGIFKDKPVVAYCRIGERSSHTWFVLKYLLGYEKVRNYDGSWTEWGNLVGVPVER